LVQVTARPVVPHGAHVDEAQAIAPHHLVPVRVTHDAPAAGEEHPAVRRYGVGGALHVVHEVQPVEPGLTSHDAGERDHGHGGVERTFEERRGRKAYLSAAAIAEDGYGHAATRSVA